MSMKYVYPAVFQACEEGGYAITFPDLPGCFSQGESIGDALEMAHSALKQWIEYLTDEKQEIPIATKMTDIKKDDGSFVNLVQADIKNERAIRRTVSIPYWMDKKTTENGLSLSRILQDALNERFSNQEIV
jgi:predicted RNase H-like HicB family nuclease